MGDADEPGETPGERVTGGDLVSEHPRALLGQRAALDVVEQQGGGMGGQAGDERRGGGLLGPRDELRQRLPVRLLAQIVGERLGSGDDEAVRPSAVDLLDRAVVLGEALLDGGRALEAGKPVSPEDHRRAGLGARTLQKVDELLFGRLEGRVRHVVDECDLDGTGVAPG